MRPMKSLGPLDLGILGCLDLLVLDDLLLLINASISKFGLVILVKPNNCIVRLETGTLIPFSCCLSLLHCVNVKTSDKSGIEP